MPAPVLVTGATGFLGSQLIRRLVRDGVSIRALVRDAARLPSGSPIEVVEGDITDPDAVDLAVKGVQSVYHCAAYVGIGVPSKDRLLMHVNVGGTALLMDAALAAGVERVVHVSSIAALGRSAGRTPEACLDESAEWTESILNTRYARSKFLAELEVQRAVAEGLDAVVVNPALIMGPGRKGENTMRIVDRVARGELPAYPAGATNVVDVQDVAAGMQAAMALGTTGERYILAGQNLSWKEIIGTLALHLGVPAPRRRMPPRLAIALGALAEVIATVSRSEPLLTRESARISGHRNCYSNEKAKGELGVTFRPFSETAARIAAGYS